MTHSYLAVRAAAPGHRLAVVSPALLLFFLVGAPPPRATVTATQVGIGTFQWPVDSPNPVTNGYAIYNAIGNNKYHTGLDLTSSIGSLTVRAAASGVARTVPNNTYANENHGMGNVIVIDHNGGNGPFSLYAHLDLISVTNGQFVSAGTPIGVMGMTGCDTLPQPCNKHLHFEVKRRGVLGNLGDDTGPHWGYTPPPDLPNLYGYENPWPYLTSNVVIVEDRVVTPAGTQVVRTGPDASQYILTVATVSGGQGFASVGETGGWYEIQFPSDYGPATGWVQAAPDTTLPWFKVNAPGTVGVNVRPSPTNSLPPLSHVWDKQGHVTLGQAASGNGCASPWYQTSLASNASATSGWVCGDYVILQSSGAGTLTEFPLPTANSFPDGITAGPDGNLWFTESAGKIGRITTAGAITEFTNAGVSPADIAAGPDGNLWFTDHIFAQIRRITTAGVITGFNIPTGNNGHSDITVGPDGNLWFTEGNGNGKIGRITTIGVIAEFPIPWAGGYPRGITAGPDGNLWFTEQAANMIGRITTNGTFTGQFTIPTPNSSPEGITAGPDGNLWFTEETGNKIGRITTAGVITEFPIPTVGSAPLAIAAGPDGNLWFTEEAGNKIGRITTAGVITEFPIPTASSFPFFIAAGPDGNIWFTEYGGNKIGRITTGPPDGDADGVSDSVEDGAPNGGDGNSDGTPDRLQTNVTSLLNVVSGSYVTLVTPLGTTLVSVRSVSNPSLLTTPAGQTFPVGFFDFRVQGLSAGAATTVSLLLPAGTNPTTYYKYGPEPGNTAPHWYEFLYDGTTGAQISGDTVTLRFVDGQRGDDDLSANGTVVEPGGPAVSAYSFYTLTPCRVADTRQSDAPLGGPALVAGAERAFALTGTCGIPVTARAVSINITVTQPTAQGHLSLYPGGTPLPLVSAINYRPGQTRANNAVVPLGPGGVLSVFCGQASGAVHFILDVNGYFQ